MSGQVLKLLESAEAYGTRWKESRRAIVRKYRETFLAALFAGFAAYGFLMTNVLNNQDNIANTPGGYGAGTASGRWFLELLAEFMRDVWGTNTLPLFNGLLSIILVALSACLAVSVLEIRGRPFMILTGLLFVTFPSFAMTMLFMFTVGYYAFSLLLTLVGVYAAKNMRGVWGVLAGAVCVTLSLGIYQAYLPVAAALFLLILIRRGFSEKTLSAIQFVLEGLRFLAVLILGLALYMAVLRLLLQTGGEALNSYQSIDQMGSVKFSELPAMIAMAFEKFFALPARREYAINDMPVMRFTFLYAMVLSAALFVWLEWRKGAELGVKLLNAVCLILFPVGAFSIVIMCYHSSIFGRMVYGAMTVFFVPMVLLERLPADTAAENASRKGKSGTNAGNAIAGRMLRRVAAAVLSGLLLLTSIGYIWESNENYMVLYHTNRQTENYAASLVTRIRMTPGYRQDLTLAFIGEDITDTTFSNEVYRKSAYHYGGYTDNSNYKKALKSYMWNYLGYHQPEASSAQITEIAATETARNMPCYPDDGSIRVIGNYIVVKLENVD